MASIFEVMRAIFAVRDDLAPEWLNEESHHSEANKRLTVALGEAIALADAGKYELAAKVLTDFAAAEPSVPHRRIAINEAARLKG
jgi:hypothetical protein